MANSYNSAAEYLNKMRQELASKKSAGHALLSTTSEYILPVTEASSLTDAVSATSAVIGTYDIVDNVGVCIANIPFDLTLDDTINTGRSAANRNDGTVTGVETYVDGPLISSTHKLRKAFSFDGSSYVTLANESNFDFDITNEFSVSFWVKLASVASSEVLVGKNDAISVNTGWGMYRSTTLFVWTLKPSTSANAQVATTTTLRTGIWYHVVGTKSTTANRTGMNIYLNGVLEATGSALAMTGVLTNAQSVVIGAESDGGVKSTSSISQVQIWNKELTQAEVTRLYAGKGISRDAAATNPCYVGFGDIT